MGLRALPPHQGKGTEPRRVFTQTFVLISSVWHKHRTAGSQMSKEGQAEELGGHRDKVSSPWREAEAALGVRRLKGKVM